MKTITLESLLEKETINPKDAQLTILHLNGLTELFKEFISTDKYSEPDIAKIETETGVKLGESTKTMLLDTGSLVVIGGNFEVPNADKLLELTNTWLNSVATEDQKGKFIVIEADGDDFTLVDSNDKIFVYSGETKETAPDGTDVITHICKHIMAKIVGNDYEY